MARLIIRKAKTAMSTEKVFGKKGYRMVHLENQWFGEREKKMGIKTNHFWCLMKDCSRRLLLGFPLVTIMFALQNPVQAATAVQQDTFSSFSCSGAPWINVTFSSSFIAQCSDGWKASSKLNTAAIAVNATDGRPSPAVELMPGQSSVSGNQVLVAPLYFYKNFKVKPGVSIDSISVDHRHGGSAFGNKDYEIVVYDGHITNTLAGQLPSALASEVNPVTHTGASYGPWLTTTFTNVVPSTNFITVRIRGPQSAWLSFGALSEVDNVTVAQTVSGPGNVEGELAEAWTGFYHGFSATGHADGADLVTDNSGNVIAAGRVHNGSNFDVAVVKYDSAGTELWATSYDGGGGDEAVATTVDSAGNIYVVARSSNGTDYDYLTLKYNSSGALQWATPPVYDNGGDDVPAGIGVDSAGNVVVTGRSANGAGFDYATIQYNSAGVQQWAQRYDNGGYDAAVGLGVDAGDNIYVTGRSDGTNQDIATLKYSAAGIALWPTATRYDIGGRDFAAAVTVDAAGNAFITGRTETGFLADFLTLKIDANGVQQWATVDDINPSDIAAAIAVDSNGDVVITGKSGRSTDYDFATVKYNGATGAKLWAAPTHGTLNVNDQGVDVATDAANNVYVTGTAGIIKNIDTLKYDANGNEIKAFSFNNASDDTSVSIAIGADGNGDATVHLSGSSFTGMDNSLVTVSYVPMHVDLNSVDISGPASANNGASITVNNSVENILNTNIGKGVDAGPFDVGLYLAPDLGGSPDLNNLIALTTRNVTGLVAGATDSANTVVTIPAPGVVSAGDYWLVAKADINSVIAEIDEANNTGVSSTTINISDLPDLIPSAVSGPASAAAGSAINIDYTIENTRAPATGSFDVSFVLSLDTTIGNGDDIPLTGTDTVTSIAGNTVSLRNASATIPNNAPIASYYIGVIADSGSAITELDENNNVAASVGTVSLVGIADLQAGSISDSLGAVQGEQITVSNTVINNGTNVGSFTVDLYISTDNTITTADTWIGSRTVTSMTAGSTSTDNTTARIPLNLAEGVYYLGMIVDPDDVIVESDETNNISAAFQTFTVSVLMDSGDGSDGDATIAGTIDLSAGNAGATVDDNGAQPDAYATLLTADALRGQVSITVSSTAGFVTGDEVLLIQVIHDTNHGAYDVVKNITVVDTTTLSFTAGLMSDFYAVGTTAKGTANTVQVVRIPQYGVLNVPVGTTLTTSAFNTATRLGGILAFRATSLTVDGTITADSLGFPGGASPIANITNGDQGWSYTGLGAKAQANNGGAGGGGVYTSSTARGGGGAGYAAAGASGTNGGGVGGGTYGNAEMTKLYLGSGGGSGARFNGLNGQGGNGGGLIYAASGTMTINASGVVTTAGGNGGNATGFRHGGGGGGSGGSMLLISPARTITGTTSVAGGLGGSSVGGGLGTNGGIGSAGRINLPDPTNADLVTSNVTLNTAGPIARGDTINVTTQVDNVTATAITTAFKVGIYLSTDAIITTADRFIGDRTVASLAGNAFDSAATNVVIPLNLYGDFGYRKALTIDAAQVSGTTDLTNFPVLVSVTDASLATVANGGRVENASGFDIKFTAADGLTELDFEVEHYDPVTGNLVAWVRVPTVSASVNTIIYVVYGSTGVTASLENAAGVWAEYGMVQHFDETTGTSVSDSTANANTGTALGNAILNSAQRKIGGAGSAVQVLAEAAYVRVNDSNSLDLTTSGSVSVWVKYGTLPESYAAILVKGGVTNAIVGGTNYHIGTTSNSATSRKYRASVTGTDLQTTSSYVSTTWDLMTLTWNGSQVVYYRDGVAIKTVNTAGVGVANTGPLDIGRRRVTTSDGRQYKGYIDEVRVSSVHRTAGWIATEFNNQDAPGTFISVGTEEPLAGGGGTPVYYLGAIADYDALVAEVSDTNNAGVMTGLGGTPEGTAVGVSGRISTSGINRFSSGSGAIGLIELILGLTGLALLAARSGRKDMTKRRNLPT